MSLLLLSVLPVDEAGEQTVGGDEGDNDDEHDGDDEDEEDDDDDEDEDGDGEEGEFDDFEDIDKLLVATGCKLFVAVTGILLFVVTIDEA